MPWNHQWTIRVDGTNVNDQVKYACTVPELQQLPAQRLILAEIDGDAPVFVRSQPQPGNLSFLIAMRDAGLFSTWETRMQELMALFSPGVYHTLAVQVRGMAAEKSLRFVVESIQPDFKTRTVVVAVVAPNPVLV